MIQTQVLLMWEIHGIHPILGHLSITSKGPVGIGLQNIPWPERKDYISSGLCTFFSIFLFFYFLIRNPISLQHVLTWQTGKPKSSNEKIVSDKDTS